MSLSSVSCGRKKTSQIFIRLVFMRTAVNLAIQDARKA